MRQHEAMSFLWRASSSSQRTVEIAIQNISTWVCLGIHAALHTGGCAWGKRQPAVHDLQAGDQEAGPSDRDSCLDGRALCDAVRDGAIKRGDMGS
jgi:hypothetical protein